ncbi:MAG: Stf0 family sulfotransferase [Omnitrophica WOR_2 bacterium]
MKPRISYVICAVQRSGSFLLCEALKNTGLAGNPEEYFLNGEGWEDGGWARQHGVTSRADYLNLVLEKGATANGVFGTKIMWNYFHLMIKSLRELPGYREMDSGQLMVSLFPNLHYIWIIRRDKVRQAVSWAKAGQTDIYAWAKGETPVPRQEPTFDFTFIDLLYGLILEGEAGWRNFFEECGVQPFTVVYEELVEAYEQTALQILEYLNVPFLENLVFGERRLQKQADAVNEAWVEKYVQLKQQAGGGVEQRPD